MTEFQRLAVINRGEPAVRLIRAVQELNRMEGSSIRTIAIYTDPDWNALFVREADEAVCLGPATRVDETDGTRRSQYLDHRLLGRILEESEIDAVWVGWGFVAEHADFAALCEQRGIVFVGPSSEVMRKLGDKITSKVLAEAANVPVAPWSGGPVATLEEARLQAERIGFPLVVKAAAGGGGRGIRTVRDMDSLGEAFASARAEARGSFGDDTLFMERRLEGTRHVEVQILGDHAGTVWSLGVRDCSLQRRHQKVLEETPCAAMTEEEHRALEEAAVRLGRQVGYTNAGTVEFLFDTQERCFSFLEVNTRLQVEHPVTECVTGLDLVKLQLQVARGETLPRTPPRSRGHAIEVRLNAEDPAGSFAPAPGTLDIFRLPGGPGIRVDTGFEEGDTISHEFDSMIAKVIAHGRTRDEALARLGRALQEAIVVIRGGASNKGFLLQLVDSVQVRDGTYDVGWLDEAVTVGSHLTTEHREVALLMAAVETYLSEVGIERSRFFASAARGRPEVGEDLGRDVALEYRGQSLKLTVHRFGYGHFRISHEGQTVHVELERLGRFQYRFRVGGRTHRVTSVVQEGSCLVEVDGRSHKVSQDTGGVVRAPSPAVVVSVQVEEGDEVSPGDRLAVLEAMKMELEIRARQRGTVREVLVMNNVQVSTGAPLLIIEEPETDSPAPAGERPDLSIFLSPVSPSGGVRQDRGQVLADLRSAVLGFDVDAAHLKRLVDTWEPDPEESSEPKAELLRLESRILEAFIDICSLFYQPPEWLGTDDEGFGRRPSEEYFFAYLHDPGAEGRGLPEEFITKLKKALRHYGIESLKRTPRLEESLFRICKAFQRLPDVAVGILSILQRRLEQVETLIPLLGQDFRETLDRLVAVTQGRLPMVHDAAREVLYQFFEEPVLSRRWKGLYQEVDRTLEQLSREENSGERAGSIQRLVDCPQPLHGHFSRRFLKASPALRQVILEVMTRRYYQIQDHLDLEVLEQDGHLVALTRYDSHDRRLSLFSVATTYCELESALETLVRLVSRMPGDRKAALDLYVWHDAPLGGSKDLTRELASLLNRTSFARPVHRIVAVLSGAPDAGSSEVRPRTFTFRPEEGGEGFREDTLSRGIHPMLGKRLGLWRLTNFDLQRLPSVEDVYIFRGTARENPADERLFALAEVQDLTAIRDDRGRLIQLPHFERMLSECLVTMRRFQLQRSPRNRLHWNRIFLVVRPPLHLGIDDLNRLMSKLEPTTRFLGLEKVVVSGTVPARGSHPERRLDIHFSNPTGQIPTVDYRDPTEEPLRPLDPYTQKVVHLRSRGLVYPYELIKMLTPPRKGTRTAFPSGTFQELDLDEAGERLVPVERPPGQNEANIVAGLITSYTSKHPQGMTRVILLGDPSRSMGSLAEAECRVVKAALDLAEERSIPVEWFAISAGARIALDTGTENMDWIAWVLRRLVTFTQAGGEVNVIVAGVNVGAQPYWNAEATMLMHTRGILIMTPDSSMVLTGKKALDYSGGVSAEDNAGIGGYERIMGPNGQAQYFAPDIAEACRILFRHYEYTYRVPGERFPRRSFTKDPPDRNICDHEHSRTEGCSFTTVGEIFSSKTNPGRKKPFDIRSVMRATADQDHQPLERWYGMHDAEVAVVWDCHLGGYPIMLLGMESRPLRRLGHVPADGPGQWTGGTLFPRASKKVARAINAASDNRPVVVLANLSGFDGSPESMRNLQLEYGAEIGRAVVNFKGPFIFCVISRYHGGAFVVFSARLNDCMEVAALEGAHASVIGGAPAAAVVFARDVLNRTRGDERIQRIERQIASARGAERVALQMRLAHLTGVVHSEMLGRVASEFDAIHSVQRAQRVGSVHHIVAPERLRPYLIEAVERGMDRWAKK